MIVQHDRPNSSLAPLRPRPAPFGSAVFRSPRKHYWLPRTIRPTREGWWFIGATFVAGLAATNTGNNLLYLILAMMLSFMAASGLLSEQTMRHIRLQRELPPRIFAGTPATFGVRLSNRKRHVPSYALRLAEADPAGGPEAFGFFLKVAPQGRENWLYSLTFPRRGWQYLPGLRLFTLFPFGLFAKTGRPVLADPVLVYPAVRLLGPDEITAVLEAGWRERYRRGRGAGLFNLRPYHPGDDPRLVHWKTSARTGELILKELEEEDRPQIRLIVEDPSPGTPLEAIEADVSYLASLAAHAIRQGASVELRTAEGSSDLGAGEVHLDRILECLALYEAPETPRPMRAVEDAGREVRLRLGTRGAGRTSAGEG
jgi:uncharacterized protein (DUF58 family)